ncbi:MAG: Npt1/Npt2 family nucleotide transporter, partial [Gemmatimonadota bacterium]
YEFARSASSSLFIKAYGAQRLPWVMALSPVGTLALVYAYGRALTWLGSRRTLAVTTLASGLALAACYLGVQAGFGPAAAALYVLREAYIVVLVEQYWSYIDSTLTAEQAKRHNGRVCGLATAGAILGSDLVGRFATTVGTGSFVLLAAATTLPCALLGLVAFRLGGEPVRAPSEERARGHLGLGLFRQHRVLPVLLAVIACTQLLAAVLELAFSILAADALPITDARTSYFGFFWRAVNVATFVLQFAVAPLLLPRLSLRHLHAGIPLVHVAAAVALLLHPALTVGAAAFLLFKAIDYSLFRAGKEVLYVPLPFDARYRAKEVIDAVGYRASKGATSLALALIGQVVALPAAALPAISAAAAGLWLGLVSRLTRDT